MKEKSNIPYVVGAVVLVLLIGGVLGQQVWLWYDGPRRVSVTRSVLDEMCKGCYKNDRSVISNVNRGRYMDGWWTPIRQEFIGTDTMVFRSAGPDKKFNTEDDITLTMNRIPPLEKKK
jgi:hypothetical protein